MKNVGSMISGFLGAGILYVFADTLVRTPGYIIYTVLFTKAEYDPDHEQDVDINSIKVAITGIVFWLSLVGLAYGLYTFTK